MCQQKLKSELVLSYLNVYKKIIENFYNISSMKFVEE